MKTLLLVLSDEKNADSVAVIIKQQISVDVKVVTSIDDGKSAVKSLGDELIAVIYDLTLNYDSYAPFGNIPTIVITGPVQLITKQVFIAQSVIDYVINLEINNIHYIIQLLKRLLYASTIKILIVDDAVMYRRLIVNILTSKRLHVLEASNGKEALEILEKNPVIRIAVVDYILPGMDGFELTQKIRAKYSKNEFPIIGISGVDQPDLAVTFMQYGANDFVEKPFRTTEFQVRVMQSIQIAESFQEVREASNRDFMTNLYNRRYFGEVGNKFFESARRGHIDISVAMIDIDNFKSINDTYGHDAGDRVIIHLAGVLTSNLRNSDIVARFGGEEFCILSTGLKAEDGAFAFERIRNIVEESAVLTDAGEIAYTISTGLAGNDKESLESMIKDADELLYIAKNSGKNMVVSNAVKR